MPFADVFTQVSFPLLSLMELAQTLLVLALVASVVMFFRPLLRGVLRALVLTVRPRLSRAERAARLQRA